MSSARGERLDADGVGERAGVERAQVRHAVDEVEHDVAGGVVVAADEHVALERRVEVAERGRGDVLERGDDPGAGRGGLHRLRERALGRQHGHGTRGRPSSRPFAIAITALPASCVGVLGRGLRPRRPSTVAITTRSAARRPRRWSPARASSTRSPHSLVRARRPIASARLRSPVSPTTHRRGPAPTARRDRRGPGPAGPGARPRHPDLASASSFGMHAARPEPGRRETAGSASGDAVGAEEDAELGEEAVAGVDAEVVAELEHGRLVGALEVHEHRAVARVLARGCSLSRATWSSLSAPSFTRIRTGGPPSSTSSGRVISIAMSLGVSSRRSSAALHAHDRVVVEQRGRSRPSSSGTPSPRARRRGPRARTCAMRSPRFVYLRDSAVTMPPTTRISPSRQLLAAR